ncbi:MAG: Spy/CpxP family protein refolding chaperone [Cyanobacteria bacterium P01_D01_bin.36]
MTLVIGTVVTFAPSQGTNAPIKLGTYRENATFAYPTHHQLKNMKFNFKTFALAGFSAIALIASPFVMSHSAQAEGGRREQVLEQLDLTADQSAQLASIREDAKAQVQTVLTAEQQATLNSSESIGRQELRQLDLSESQREQLRAIREATREEVSEVLTAEQREQLDELRAERGGRGEGRRGEGPRSAR